MSVLIGAISVIRSDTNVLINGTTVVMSEIHFNGEMFTESLQSAKTYFAAGIMALISLKIGEISPTMSFMTDSTSGTKVVISYMQEFASEAYKEVLSLQSANAYLAAGTITSTSLTRGEMSPETSLINFSNSGIKVVTSLMHPAISFV